MGYVCYTRSHGGLIAVDLMVDWHAENIAAFLRDQGYDGATITEPHDFGEYGVGLCSDQHIGDASKPISSIDLIEVGDGSFVCQVNHGLGSIAAEINLHRDELINSGFVIDGVLYQSRPEDRENMAGASTLALAAMTNGAVAGDYRWHGGDSDFSWIAADNSTHKMDAQTMFAFGAAALAHKQAHIFAARDLKDADPIPDDWQDPAYWP